MDFQPPVIDYLVVLPLLFVAGTGLLLMILDLLLSADRARRAAPVLTMVGLFGGLITSLALWNGGRSAFSVAGGYPMLVADNFAVALNAIFAISGILTVLLSVNYLQRTGHDRPECSWAWPTISSWSSWPWSCCPSHSTSWPACPGRAWSRKRQR